MILAVPGSGEIQPDLRGGKGLNDPPIVARDRNIVLIQDVIEPPAEGVLMVPEKVNEHKKSVFLAL
jgi:hypothetical protein